MIAYLANADNRDYYLVSVADQILLNPFGLLAFRGLERGLSSRAQVTNTIEFMPIRHGKYKSALEPFTRENFSRKTGNSSRRFVYKASGKVLPFDRSKLEKAMKNFSKRFKEFNGFWAEIDDFDAIEKSEFDQKLSKLNRAWKTSPNSFLNSNSMSGSDLIV